jgi:CDP-2,3-bis-(O-geranylgeranyl)-sn-glycerol synthase
MSQILWVVPQSVWFYLPAAIANIAPVLVLWIPWDKPIWARGLGQNKTWRGLFAGILASVLVVMLQTHLAPNLPKELLIFPYQESNAILLGAVIGGGALIGDAVKSYFKRRLQICPGAKWWPYDQLDFIVGSTVLVIFVFPQQILEPTGFLVLGIALCLTMFLHPAINYVGFKLHLKKVPW